MDTHEIEKKEAVMECVLLHLSQSNSTGLKTSGQEEVFLINVCIEGLKYYCRSFKGLLFYIRGNGETERWGGMK